MTNTECATLIPPSLAKTGVSFEEGNAELGRDPLSIASKDRDFWQDAFNKLAARHEQLRKEMFEAIALAEDWKNKANNRSEERDHWKEAARKNGHALDHQIALREESEAREGSFSWALEASMNGHAVKRCTWSDSFVYFVPANAYPAQTGVAKAYFGDKSLVPYGAYLARKFDQGIAEGNVGPWTPSHQDMFATDWVVIDITTRKVGSADTQSATPASSVGGL